MNTVQLLLLGLEPRPPIYDASVPGLRPKYKFPRLFHDTKHLCFENITFLFVFSLQFVIFCQISSSLILISPVTGLPHKFPEWKRQPKQFSDPTIPTFTKISFACLNLNHFLSSITLLTGIDGVLRSEAARNSRCRTLVSKMSQQIPSPGGGDEKMGVVEGTREPQQRRRSSDILKEIVCMAEGRVWD